jgi:hypothetical protein
MLHGDKAVFHTMLTNETVHSLYFAWDVTQVMPCNEAARTYLTELATWALNLSIDRIEITQAEGPLWGTCNIPHFVNAFVTYVDDGYEYVMSDRKKENLKKALRTRLSLYLEGVPRNKKAMLAMYPELAPVKKRRKKKDG